MADTITAKAQPERSFVKAPEGQHQSVCVDVVDLGMHEQFWDGKSKGKVHKCAVVFQVDTVNPETRKRYEISQQFTVSMGEKATLRKFLGAWRGKTYSDAEAEAGVPLDKLEGVNGLMQIEHQASKRDPERIYANIVSLTPLPKGMQKIAAEDYTRDEYWKERIKLPEPEAPSNDGEEPDDDSLPF
jgi:hypothetical protein